MKESSRKPFRKWTVALCTASGCWLSRSAFVQMESRRATSVPLSWLLWDALALEFTSAQMPIAQSPWAPRPASSSCVCVGVRNKHTYKSCIITRSRVIMHTCACKIMRAHTRANLRNYMWPHAYTHTTSRRIC